MYLMLQLDCDVNLLNKKHYLALHYALISHMPFEVLKILCTKCLLKLAKNDLGITPLHLACSNTSYLGEKKKELLKLICDESNVDVQDSSGNTPLHIVCKYGDIDSVIYFVSELHCNVNLLNNDDYLAIHYAVEAEKAKEMVRYVSNGCTLLHMKNKFGMTPLHYAIKRRRIDTVRYLVREVGCIPSSYKQCLEIYADLDIGFACSCPSDLDILKAFANEKNVNEESHFLLSGDFPIHIACFHHNLLAIEFLIGLKCKLSSRGYHDRIPLHIACTKSLRCVELVIDESAGNLINFCDRDGNTPLHLAVQGKDLSIVEFLLENLACDVTVPNKKNEIPLHVACKVNLLCIVKRFIQIGCDYVNDQTKDGDSPLHIACKYGAFEICKLLVEYCDCTSSMMLRNNTEGRLPVDYACKYSLEMVKLVSRSCTYEHLTFRDYNRRVLGLMFCHRHKPTTLDIACCSGSLDIVKYLINEKGCSLSALSGNHSALAYACGIFDYDPSFSYDVHPKSWPNIVKYLIAHCGYDPGVSSDGISVFKFAFEQRDFALVKALTIKSVDIMDIDGNYPLHYACSSECVDIVKFLVDRGCDQTVLNKDGELALHIACRSSLQIVKLLTKCDSNSLNADGNTPLHIACKVKNEDIVKYLVEELKCDVNIQNGTGDIPLHILCGQSHCINVASFILTKEVDINCKNIYGDTPLHIACHYRNCDIIELLLSKECRADIPNKDGKLAMHALVDYDFNGYPRYKPEEFPHVVKMIYDRYSAAAFTACCNRNPLELLVIAGDVESLDVLLGDHKGDEAHSFMNRLLHIACEHGKSLIVRWLIDHGADPENINDEGNLPQHTCFKRYCNLDTLKQLGRICVCKQNGNKDTILHMVCTIARQDVLKYILEIEDNNSKTCFLILNADGDTPLHLLATSRIDSQEILELIQCDNPDVQDNYGNTPLHLACQHANPALIKLLLSHCKCNCKIANNNDELPLHLIAARLPDPIELVKVLATPDTINKRTATGDTPLHIACQASQLEDVQHVLDIAHQASQQTNHDTVQHMLSMNCDRNIVNNSGSTPLHNAVKTTLHVVKLVATNQNVNVQNCDGDTPLHIACKNCLYNRQSWDIIKYLIERCRCLLDAVNNHNDSAFHILLNNENTKSVNHMSMEYYNILLLLNGKRFHIKPLLPYIPISLIDQRNNHGDTILHIASRESNEETIKYLVESTGCNIYAVNTLSGVTPLHFVSARGFEEVVKLSLIPYGEPATITDVSSLSTEYKFECGDTYLHVACRYGNHEIVQHILESGHTETLNCCNVHQDLPVHLACEQSKSMITLFSAYKDSYDCNAVNESGDSPLHIVCRSKPTDYLVKLLVQTMKCRVDIQNKEGNLPLHIVCQGKQTSIGVIRLLTSKLDDDKLFLCNNCGKTALCEFLQSPHQRYGLRHFKSMLEIFIRRCQHDALREKFIPLACRYCKLKFVKFLCETYIPSPSARLSARSLLYHACLNHNKEVLDYILNKYEHNVNEPHTDGDLPVHLALQTKVCTKSTIFLIKSTANINQRNSLGNTPLHEVYRSDKTFGESHRQILMTFLQLQCVDISVQNLKGETPLH